MRRILSLLLAAVMALLPVPSLTEETEEELPEESTEAARYIYRDAVSALPACWNPLASGEDYPGNLLRGGLYAFLFNDALHPMAGQEPFSCCVIVPEMADGEPIDVTEQVKTGRPEFGIPASAAEGYAYAIGLNPACVWEDGTPINADTYVYSMMRLLDPELQNTHAADFFAGDLRVAGAEAYASESRDEMNRAETDSATVGLYKSGEYQITLVLETPMTGQELMRCLTGSWLVKEDLYEIDPAAYCTNAETTASCGPYKLESCEPGKSMRFTRNETWFGYQDGKHVYADPESGDTRGMYMADAIDIQSVPEADGRLQMFLRGELTEYALQREDYAAYRDSGRARFIPAETVFFLALNGNLDAIAEREAAGDFDAQAYDLQTLTLQSFRKALFLSFDREAFAAAVSPARMACWGLIGDAYLYGAETGLCYRDAEPARQALLAAYGEEPDAKAYYQAAFDEALAAGYITDENGDGLCDQIIQMEYAADSDSPFLDRVMECLNEQLAIAARDTPFRDSVRFSLSAPCGEMWSARVREGLSDAALMGWPGDCSDPYALMDLHVNPAYALDAQWANADEKTLAVTLNGEDLTASLKDWCGALNGQTVTIGEKEYCFGRDQASVETRLTLLAAVEEAVLCGCDCIPMVQDAHAVLVSRQIDHVTDTCHPILGFGGVMYDRFNYDESAWEEYVNAQPGGVVGY